MDLIVFVKPLLRWWWLLLAATVLAAITSLFFALRQPPIYEARTTLLIGRTIEDPNPTSMQFNLAQQLAETYAQIANREPVREATMQALGLPWLPSYRADALPNTQIIEILVSDTSPKRAAIVADELANQLVLRSPATSNPDEAERQQFISEQLDALTIQIEETQAEIDRLSTELGNLNSAREISDTETQIATLNNKLNELRRSYADLLSNTGQGALNILTVIESATVPTIPIGPNRAMTVIVTASLALVLAATAAYFLEYLDDTIKSPDDLKRITNIPLLGMIAELPEEDRGTYIVDQPMSPIADAFRTLRTNIEFSSIDQPHNTIVVCSMEDSDGKSTIATNLAISFAQADRKTILVDADLRSPSIHKMVDVPRNPGLGDAFLNRLDVLDVIHYFKNNRKLMVIPAGSPPPDFIELLGTKKMGQVLTSLEEISDIVIIDGPPIFVPDSMMLSSKADGVLIVISAGRTRRGNIHTMTEQLNRVGTNIIGFVLNRVSINSGYYGNYYYYTAYYDTKDGGQKGKTKNVKSAGNQQKRMSFFKKRESNPPKTREV